MDPEQKNSKVKHGL